MSGGLIDIDALTQFKQKMLGVVDDRLSGLSAVSIVASGTGYRVLSDGRIEQWGKVLVLDGEGTRLVFPLTFKTAVESITCTAAGSVPVSYSVNPDENLGAATIKHNGNGGVVTYYRAIGR